MRAVPDDTADLRLVVHDKLSESYEQCEVLLARAGFDGTLQLLSAGWETILGCGRRELGAKTLVQLMWLNQRSAAVAVAAILDILNPGPVDLRLCCSGGLGKCFRVHRLYDRREHVMYIVAEETAQKHTAFIAADGERRRISRT